MIIYRQLSFFHLGVSLFGGLVTLVLLRLFCLLRDLLLRRRCIEQCIDSLLECLQFDEHLVNCKPKVFMGLLRDKQLLGIVEERSHLGHL